MKQHEAVIEAMKQLGGYANFGQLYQLVPKIPNCKWGTKTPFASIRRIVQTHSEFFRIESGLWGLETERSRILKHLDLGETAHAQKRKDFTHYYYQGLAVQIGNLKGFQTCVPNQDKNRPYLQSKLADIATLPDCYEFTYEHLVRRAKSIDAVWFNERKLPYAFFEIEHSTDIYNSLIKFTEFEDFRIKFYIVANEKRHPEYQDKLALNVFKPVRSVVRFLDYEKIADWHSKVAAYVTSEKDLDP